MKTLILCLFIIRFSVPGFNPLLAQIPWKVKELVPGGRFDAIVSPGGGRVIAGTREPSPGIIFKSEDHVISRKSLGNITENNDANRAHKWPRQINSDRCKSLYH